MVERVERLIWSYNAAIETARDAWLRDELPAALNERLLLLKTPLAYGLPWFVDEQQQRRAMLQGVAISRRLTGRNTIVDRIVERMHTIEISGIGTSLGGGASITIANKGARWLLIKQGPDDPAHQAQPVTPKIAASLIKLIIRKRQKAAAECNRAAGASAALGSTIGAARSRPTLPLASLANAPQESTESLATAPQSSRGPGTGASTRRGDQTQYSKSAEEIVSEATGVPLNERGANEQRIPGTGPGGYRVPDLKSRGRSGSLRTRSSIIEIKASRGKKFKSLSKRARQQILDEVAFAERVRAKAGLVRDPARRRELLEFHVEVFTDLDPPVRGKFEKLIEQKWIKWRQIPRPPATAPIGPKAPPRVSASQTTVGKPGLGTVQNVALGVIISIVEAGAANEVYRKSAATLNDLLRQMAENGDADQAEWTAIESRLREIQGMKQSWWGVVWEVISYGQGSIVEKQGVAMILFAWELADKHGYKNRRTMYEAMKGEFGRFERIE